MATIVLEPQWWYCKYWRPEQPAEKTGKWGARRRDWGSPLRRCARAAGFYTLPQYLCQSFLAREADKLCSRPGELADIL